MKIIIVIFWFIIFTKLLFFWLWLWQLKEYHFGRFKAHFEAQAAKKIISSFWRIKYPKFTFKMILVFLVCLAVEILLLLYFQIVFAILLSFFFIPLLILFFQIPSAIWRKIAIRRAKKKRASFKNLLVIGITGSYGKTSTKEFLAKLLSSRFRVLKTKEHQNSEIGISRCVLNELQEEHEIFVVEMAAYNKGGIKLLCDIVKPKIGMVTGVNEQHLATFETMENLLSAEGGGELIESLPEDGVAFFNAQNEHCRNLYQKTGIKKFLYGENASFRGGENILGAVAVARELGMREEEILRACEKIENKFPGIEIKKGVNGLNIIDATYSANPDGVLAHLEYLKTLPGKKAVVMPCLIELGKASAEVHRKIGKKIGEACDLAIIITKDRFKEVREGAGEKALFLEDVKDIFEKIMNFCSPGDVVLLESRMPGRLIELLIP